MERRDGPRGPAPHRRQRSRLVARARAGVPGEVMTRCATCGKPLRVGAKRWHRECVPAAFFASQGQNFQRNTFRRRRAKFAADLDRLTSSARTLTREGLLDFAATILDRGWHLGYGACEAKWRKRAKQEAA